MQALIMTPPKKQRRSRKSKETATITFRLELPVKKAITTISDITGRSDNLQVEVFIKVGYLHAMGVNIFGMSEIQIMQQFDKYIGEVEEVESDD